MSARISTISSKLTAWRERSEPDPQAVLKVSRCSPSASGACHFAAIADCIALAQRVTGDCSFVAVVERAQSGPMPLSLSSLIACSFFDKCDSPMPRSTFGALVN
jgi:hypothetical protein